MSMDSETGTFLPPISDQPQLFLTHYVQLTKKDKKGSLRYQCRTCNHSFVSCGKRRLFEHILGEDYPSERSKGVAICTNPYLPLKISLFHSLRNDRSISSGFLMGESEKKFDSMEDNTDEVIETLLQELDDLHQPAERDALQLSPNQEPLVMIQKRSFYSAEITPFEMSSCNYHSPAPSISSPLTHYGSESPFTEAVSEHSTPQNHYDRNGQVDSRVVDLNRAILKFFISYGIPLTEVDSLSFQSFFHTINQVLTSGTMH